MTVIRDVDENTANAILYGFNSETTEYFKNKYNMFKESIVTNNPLANTHAGFFNNLNYINSDAYITNIKDKLHSLSVAGNDDENIYYYNNPVDANTITISSFNLYRRAVATKTIKELIEDGRIQPARIEEIYKKVKSEFDKNIQKEGEDVVLELGIKTMHPEHN
jgi:hypothetical protein